MRRRILLATLLAVAVTACALGIPLGYSALTVVESVTRSELAARAEQVATIVDDQLAAGQPIRLEKVRLAVPKDGRLVVTTRSTGTLTYGAKPDHDTITEQVPTVHAGSVQLSEPAGPMRTQQLQYFAFVVLLVVLSVGIGTIVAVVTARRLAEPLRHLAGRADRLGGGDFRPDPDRYDVIELDMVAQTLDSSATALARVIQRERDLVGDVSHQLRSRLTALQLRIETLSEHPDEDVAAEASAAIEQAERLATVLDELLAAARAARSVEAEPVDLSLELNAIAGEWRDQLRAEGRALRARLPDGLRARATPGRLREAIGVLLDNALRHGGGTVTLSARRGDATVVIEVGDAGAGVPDDLVPHVFERGVSGGGSTGVGLALARALVDADGGRLELASARPATFAVFLPLPRADDVIGTSWPTGKSPR